MFEREGQIWAKVLVKKETMQCTKMKTHTKACYSCKITKTNNFFQILVTSIHETDSFLIIGILMGFPYISDFVKISGYVMF